MRAFLGLVTILAACGPTPTRKDQDVDAQPTPDSQVQPPGDTSTGARLPEARHPVRHRQLRLDGPGADEPDRELPAVHLGARASGLDYRVAVTTTARDYHYTMSFADRRRHPDGHRRGRRRRDAQAGRVQHDEALDRQGAIRRPRRRSRASANVGTSGNSDEMPLGAMRDAFEERMTDNTNAGFRRTDALLGVVFLTDEEDCSYEQSVTLCFCAVAVRRADGARRRTTSRSSTSTPATARAGPPPRSRAWGRATAARRFGNAAEATRLKSFVQQAGANARMSSICDGDLSVSLAQTLELFESACGGILL